MNKNFNEMLSVLSAESVEFLIVGGYALAVHGYVRATGDLRRSRTRQRSEELTLPCRWESPRPRSGERGHGRMRRQMRNYRAHVNGYMFRRSGSQSPPML